MTSQSELDEYICLFREGHDPATSEPVAIFDRMVFVTDFIKALRGKVEFSDEPGVAFLTVAEWRELRRNST